MPLGIRARAAANVRARVSSRLARGHFKIAAKTAKRVARLKANVQRHVRQGKVAAAKAARARLGR